MHAAFETARTLTVKRLSALVQTSLDIGRSLSVMGLLLLLSLLGTFSLPSVVAEDPALDHVDHPQPALRGRQRVVDHRECLIVDAACGFEAVEGGERAGE